MKKRGPGKLAITRKIKQEFEVIVRHVIFGHVDKYLELVREFVTKQPVHHAVYDAYTSLYSWGSIRNDLKLRWEGVTGMINISEISDTKQYANLLRKSVYSAYTLRAKLYQEENQIEKAILDLKHSIELAPFNTSLERENDHLLLSKLLEDQGRVYASLYHLRKAYPSSYSQNASYLDKIAALYSEIKSFPSSGISFYSCRQLCDWLFKHSNEAAISLCYFLEDKNISGPEARIIGSDSLWNRFTIEVKTSNNNNNLGMRDLLKKLIEQASINVENKVRGESVDSQSAYAMPSLMSSSSTSSASSSSSSTATSGNITFNIHALLSFFWSLSLLSLCDVLSVCACRFFL
jgi:tetratricopeptide (TPR) repeat protein